MGGGRVNGYLVSPSFIPNVIIEHADDKHRTSNSYLFDLLHGDFKRFSSQIHINKDCQYSRVGEQKPKDLVLWKLVISDYILNSEHSLSGFPRLFFALLENFVECHMSPLSCVTADSEDVTLHHHLGHHVSDQEIQIGIRFGIGGCFNASMDHGGLSPFVDHQHNSVVTNRRFRVFHRMTD